MAAEKRIHMGYEYTRSGPGQPWVKGRAVGSQTLKTRKAEADIRSTTASAERTEATTPLDAEGIFLANQEKRRRLGLPVLTPAQEQADKDFAKEYVGWRNTGGIATLNRQLDQLQNALNILRTNDTITGPVIGRMPKFIQQAINPKAPDVRAQVEDVIQRSLRQILGAQFTQVEGERMISRAYDPEQQEASNIERLNRVIAELRGQGAAKEASSRFFEEKGTLQGFTQKDVDKVAKEYGSTNTPKGGSNWMTKDQEALVNRYANGNPTAQGYADLMVKLAQEQGFEPSEDFKQQALLRGQQVEQYRQQGGTYGKGINYLDGVPKPPESEKDDRDKIAAAVPAAGAPPSGGATPPSNGGDGLSWGEAAQSAAARFLPNVGEVAVDTAKGLYQIVANPIETAQSIGELGSSLLGAMGVTDADPAQAKALGDYLEKRYGGVENIKKTFAEEPAALLLDLSTVLTAGGTGAAKLATLAGKTGKIGQTVATVGRVIDPVSAAVASGETIADLARKYTPQVVKRGAEAVTQRAPAAVVGFPSGVGTETIVEAAGAGRSSGRNLGSTPRSEAFRGQQVGGASASEILDSFEQGVNRIRDAASKKYEVDILPITRDKTQLDIADVESKVAALKPKGYGVYKMNRKPSSHAAWEEAQNLVDQHKQLMAQDPARYATPAALDTFRREMYEALQGYAEGADRGASRIANGVYHAVRDTIKKQAPDYDRVLKDYSKARDTMDQMQRSLKTGQNIDSSVRRMQSIMRRNDPGYAGELLEQVDDTGQLSAQIAGRSGSSYLPDRLRGALLATQGAAGTLAMAPGELFANLPQTADLLTPSFLAGAASMSPRLATSGAYRFGQGVGAAERGFSELRDLYQKYPEAFGAGVAGISGAERAGEELSLDKMAREYGVYDVPEATDAPQAGGSITARLPLVEKVFGAGAQMFEDGSVRMPDGEMLSPSDALAIIRSERQ